MENNEQQVWYAAYGSNLSKERFYYYIKGGFCHYNGKTYAGCENKTLWSDSKIKIYPGKIYFGGISATWKNKGVAFFNQNEVGKTYMKLYKITWQQLLDVQKQEGNSPEWYDALVQLDVLEDGCPVYTITSETIQEKNEPAREYVDLIASALSEEYEMTTEAATKYLQDAML